jgi:hypothetical protein
MMITHGPVTSTMHITMLGSATIFRSSMGLVGEEGVEGYVLEEVRMNGNMRLAVSSQGVSSG